LHYDTGSDTIVIAVPLMMELPPSGLNV